MAKGQSKRRGKSGNSNGMMDMARERPVSAAAAAAGVAAAGVFLWSKRSQIGDQLSNLSEQIGEWTDSLNGASVRELETVDGAATTTPRRNRSPSSGSRRSATAGSTISSGNSATPAS